MQRVAIAGFGAIGKVVAEHLDRGIDGLALAAVSARDVVRAETAMDGFACRVPVLPLVSSLTSAIPNKRSASPFPPLAVLRSFV